LDVVRAIRLSDRVVWWAVVVFVTLWGGAYALGSPPLAGGDEIMHVLKGATVARGELIGEAHPMPVEEVPVYGPEIAKFHMHQWVASGGAECFRGQPEVVANCFDYSGDQGELGDTWYPDNKYQPLYYAAVGVPSRLVDLGGPANYVMRLVSVLLSAMVLASAVLSVRRYRGARLAALGLLVAITPTVIATSAQVTPNNLEITAALACWATVLLVAFDARAGRLPARRVVVRLAVTASILAVMRPASPLVLAIIVCSGAVVAGWRPALTLLRHRPLQVAAVAIVAAVAFTAYWYVTKKPILVGLPVAPDLDTWDIFQYALGKNGDQYAVMVGAFGTPDFNAPPFMQVAWAVLLGLLACLAALFGRMKMLLWTIVLIGAALALQIGFDVLLRNSIGPNWSAKYSLPLTVGIPLLLGFAAGERSTLDASQLRRLRGGFAIIVVAVQVAALWQFMRRYSVGYSGPLWFWTEPLWTSPVAGLLLLVLGIAGCGATVATILVASGSEPGAPSPGGDERHIVLGDDEVAEVDQHDGGADGSPVVLEARLEDPEDHEARQSDDVRATA
jgi:hypothetical protein